MSAQAKAGTYITQAWLVIALALFYGGALAGVHTWLSDRIDENRRNETYEQIPQLVEGAVAERTVEHLVVGKNDEETTAYEARDANDRHVGWVLVGSGQGFADRIVVLVGTTPEVTEVTGIYVLEQKETPGLGDYISDEDRFQSQFRGTRPPLEVVKSDAEGPHEIQALTGATISSEAVTSIVNKTIENLRQPLRELAPPPGDAEAQDTGESRGTTSPDENEDSPDENEDGNA